MEDVEGLPNRMTIRIDVPAEATAEEAVRLFELVGNVVYDFERGDWDPFVTARSR